MSKPPVNLGRITDNFGDDHEFLRESTRSTWTIVQST